MTFETPGLGALPALYCARHTKVSTMQGLAYHSTLKLEFMWAVAGVPCAECSVRCDGKMGFYHASRCAVERTWPLENGCISNRLYALSVQSNVSLLSCLNSKSCGVFVLLPYSGHNTVSAGAFLHYLDSPSQLPLKPIDCNLLLKNLLAHVH